MSSKTPPNTSPQPRAQVKKENEEEIKEFAETAMNELLGWYGYERLELRRWAASRARDTSSPDNSTDQKTKDECSWCNKSIPEDGGALQQAGASFCSELCFSQSRRANFKRAKTCDWCRHVRHTVAYVDFQDGATQLQFCSDKCLNQYKMHIFCRETQAHLDLNPHLVSAASSSNLITPELWLKNCKSRSVSPTSERSASPENMSIKQSQQEKVETQKVQNRKSPLITITPTAKLMRQKIVPEERLTVRKSPENKKELKTIKMNLRKRRTSKCSATVTSQNIRQTSSTPKAQDLRMCSPSIDGSSPSSAMENSGVCSPPHQNSQNLPTSSFHNPMFGMPPPPYVDNNHSPMNDFRHNIFPPRFNFIPRPGIPLHPERPRFHPPINFPHPLGQTPPVTVLVPYPVVVPIPLPIPIPLPLTSFIQAYCMNKVKVETKNDEPEGPLDFTMHGDKKQNNDEGQVISNSEGTREQNDVDDRIDDLRTDKPPNDVNGPSNPEHSLPKFKITRVGNKMAKIVTKSKESSESSRPLRKRRRIVESATGDDTLIPKTRKIVEV